MAKFLESTEAGRYLETRGKFPPRSSLIALVALLFFAFSSASVGAATLLLACFRNLEASCDELLGIARPVTIVCAGRAGHVSLDDALDGCERILRDEFKDYPERALYMIGAVDEAKGKAKPGLPAAAAKPESKTEAKPEAKTDPKPASASRAQASSEPRLKPDPKPEPEVEHAAGIHES